MSILKRLFRRQQGQVCDTSQPIPDAGDDQERRKPEDNYWPPSQPGPGPVNGDYLPVLLNAAGWLLEQILPPTRGHVMASFWAGDNTRLVLHNWHFPMTRFAPLFPGRHVTGEQSDGEDDHAVVEFPASMTHTQVVHEALHNIITLLTDREGVAYAPWAIEERRQADPTLTDWDCMAIMAYDGFSKERGITPDDDGRTAWVKMWRDLDAPVPPEHAPRRPGLEPNP